MCAGGSLCLPAVRRVSIYHVWSHWSLLSPNTIMCPICRSQITVNGWGPAVLFGTNELTEWNQHVTLTADSILSTTPVVSVFHLPVNWVTEPICFYVWTEPDLHLHGHRPDGNWCQLEHKMRTQLFCSVSCISQYKLELKHVPVESHTSNISRTFISAEQWKYEMCMRVRWRFVWASSRKYTRGCWGVNTYSHSYAHVNVHINTHRVKRICASVIRYASFSRNLEHAAGFWWLILALYNSCFVKVLFKPVSIHDELAECLWGCECVLVCLCGMETYLRERDGSVFIPEHVITHNVRQVKGNVNEHHLLSFKTFPLISNLKSNLNVKVTRVKYLSAHELKEFLDALGEG